MGSLVGYSIVEGLSGLHTFADDRRDLLRRKQRTGIDRGRLGIIGANLRRGRGNCDTQGGQQNPYVSAHAAVRAMEAKAASPIIGIDHCDNSGKDRNLLLRLSQVCFHTPAGALFGVI
jgi:hypothetical protein